LVFGRGGEREGLFEDLDFVAEGYDFPGEFWVGFWGWFFGGFWGLRARMGWWCVMV
jgi:hypothetical protein